MVVPIWYYHMTIKAVDTSASMSDFGGSTNPLRGRVVWGEVEVTSRV